MKRKDRPMKARTKCQGELENHEESGAYIYTYLGTNSFFFYFYHFIAIITHLISLPKQLIESMLLHSNL